MQAPAESKHFIDLAKAKKLTGKFRQKKKEVLSDKYKDKNVLPTCETFDRLAIDALLQQPGCAGIRIYLGMDDKDEVNLVLVGVNEKGEDMLPSGTDSVAAEPQIVDNGTRCPTECPSSSPLNT